MSILTKSIGNKISRKIEIHIKNLGIIIFSLLFLKRSKNDNGGNVADWNREHTYAQSLATPSMNTSSPNAGTDAHHLRSSDVQMNGNRGNRKFATGSGNSGNSGSNWYPGDEWKGDVARMMMYMYLRYPSQCPPNDVGVGTSVERTFATCAYHENYAACPTGAVVTEKAPITVNIDSPDHILYHVNIMGYLGQKRIRSLILYQVGFHSLGI